MGLGPLGRGGLQAIVFILIFTFALCSPCPVVPAQRVGTRSLSYFYSNNKNKNAVARGSLAEARERQEE